MAARAGREFTGFLLFVRNAVALRDMVAARVVRPVVARRDLTRGCALFLFVTLLVPRATVLFAVVRSVILIFGADWRETVLRAVMREMVFSSRTAPLAMPTAAINVAIKI